MFPRGEVPKAQAHVWETLSILARFTNHLPKTPQGATYRGYPLEKLVKAVALKKGDSFSEVIARAESGIA